jgi:hypothetical protein
MGIISYMNIHDLPTRIKSSYGPDSTLSKLFLSLIIILVATLSFGVGRLSVMGNREPMKIEIDESLIQQSGQKSTPNTASVIQALPKQGASAGEVVASSKGSKYHYPHCSGAKQISENNRIVFKSPGEAEAAGYTLAANCKSQ